MPSTRFHIRTVMIVVAVVAVFVAIGRWAINQPDFLDFVVGLGFLAALTASMVAFQALLIRLLVSLFSHLLRPEKKHSAQSVEAKKV